MSLSRGCRLFGISRQAVYQAKQRAEERAKVLTQIKPLIQTARMQMPRSGTRKLYFLWKDHFDRMQIKTGRDALSGYLRSEHLLIKPEKNYTRTTHSKHGLRKFPDLIKEMEADRPEQAFVSDITYIKSRERTHYLSLVTDACSRKIMSHHLSDDMSAEHVVS